MSQYPSLLPLKWNQDVLSVVSGFGGGYKGLAANYWWGGGSGTGLGLMAPDDNSDGNATLTGYRIPLMNDGVTQTWYYQNTGNPARDQQLIDQWLFMLYRAGVKGNAFIYYSRADDLVSLPVPAPAGIPLTEVIYHWFDLYDASVYKPLVKFALMVISKYASYDENSATVTPVAVGTWLNLPTMAAYWASKFLDSQYIYDVQGRPIIYPFDDTNTWDQAHIDEITTAANNVGIPEVNYVNANNKVTGPFNQTVPYGPAGNDLTAGGNIEQPYQNQINKDGTNRAPKNRPQQVGLTTLNDGRPVRGSTTWWADYPTYTEAELQVVLAYNYARAVRTNNVYSGPTCPDTAVFIYGPQEIAEGGDFYPTLQNIAHGCNNPSRGVWLDALYNVVRNLRPERYKDWYHFASKSSAFTRTGASWTISSNLNRGGGLNPAPWQFRLEQGSTIGDKIVFTPKTDCEQIDIYATTGPTFGTMNVHTDAGADTLVSLFSLTVVDNVLVYSTGALTPGVHSVTSTIVSGTVNLEKARVSAVRVVAPP